MESDLSVTLTVGQVRAFLDGGDELEELTAALDEAQGSVVGGSKKSATILITINKE